MRISVIAAGVIGSLSIASWTFAAVGAEPRPQKQTVCPVMGGAVNTNLFVDHAGKRIYACCTGCLPDLKKDPAAFIAKLEKSGVALDKTPPANPGKNPAGGAGAAPATGGHAHSAGGCK